MKKGSKIQEKFNMINKLEENIKLKRLFFVQKIIAIFVDLSIFSILFSVLLIVLFADFILFIPLYCIIPILLFLLSVFSEKINDRIDYLLKSKNDKICNLLSYDELNFYYDKELKKVQINFDELNDRNIVFDIKNNSTCHSVNDLITKIYPYKSNEHDIIITFFHTDKPKSKLYSYSIECNLESNIGDICAFISNDLKKELNVRIENDDFISNYQKVIIDLMCKKIYESISTKEISKIRKTIYNLIENKKYRFLNDEFDNSFIINRLTNKVDINKDIIFQHILNNLEYSDKCGELTRIIIEIISKKILQNSNNELNGKSIYSQRAKKIIKHSDKLKTNYKKNYTSSANRNYVNHCWHCHSHIDSSINKKCGNCGWYICKKCGSCSPNCSQR